MKKPLERLAAPPGKYRWPPRLLRMLGRVSDREVARRGRLHLQTVSEERRRRRIPAKWPHRPRVRWTAAMVALLGTAIDREVAWSELPVTPGNVVEPMTPVT